MQFVADYYRLGENLPVADFYSLPGELANEIRYVLSVVQQARAEEEKRAMNRAARRR